MAVKTNQYISQIAQDTSRGPSQGIWGDCPVEDFIQAFGGGIGTAGYLVQDDFCPVATPSNTTPAIGVLGQWANWSAAGTTVLDAAEEGGVAIINGTTTAKSFILTSNAGMFRLVGNTPFNLVGGKFWMEFRIAVGSIAASQHAIFCGLADNTGSQINSVDTSIIVAAGTSLTTTKNILGFFKTAVSGTPTGTLQSDWSAVYQPAAGTAVYPNSLQQLSTTVVGSPMAAYAASAPVGKGTGFIKLGMVYDPGAAVPTTPAPATPPTGQTQGTLYRPTIKFFVNGQVAPAFLANVNLQASTFPNNCVFSPVFNYMNISGASAPVYLDWVRFAQLASF